MRRRHSIVKAARTAMAAARTATAAMGSMPMGMPTGGFAPPAVPPNMIAGAPQWGMPITGTPIGLPGPPHVPLGSPAGLQQTRDEESHAGDDAAASGQVQLSVKQRRASTTRGRLITCTSMKRSVSRFGCCLPG